MSEPQGVGPQTGPVVGVVLGPEPRKYRTIGYCNCEMAEAFRAEVWFNGLPLDPNRHAAQEASTAGGWIKAARMTREGLPKYDAEGDLILDLLRGVVEIRVPL